MCGEARISIHYGVTDKHFGITPATGRDLVVKYQFVIAIQEAVSQIIPHQVILHFEGSLRRDCGYDFRNSPVQIRLSAIGVAGCSNQIPEPGARQASLIQECFFHGEGEIITLCLTVEKPDVCFGP